MKKIVGWLSVSLFCVFQQLCGLAMAQTGPVCGPYSPFGRLKDLNPDGTWDGVSWIVGTNAQCEIPDPTSWFHTYTLLFPETIQYNDGVDLQFVGDAVAYVEGKNNPVGRSCRLVFVTSATFTDSNGNTYPLSKTRAGSYPYQYDQWTTTTPLASGVTYSFSVGGTDPCINKASDTLVINAKYKQVQPPPAPVGDGVIILE